MKSFLAPQLISEPYLGPLERSTNTHAEWSILRCYFACNMLHVIVTRSFYATSVHSIPSITLLECGRSPSHVFTVSNMLRLRYIMTWRCAADRRADKRLESTANRGQQDYCLYLRERCWSLTPVIPSWLPSANGPSSLYPSFLSYKLLLSLLIPYLLLLSVLPYPLPR